MLYRARYEIFVDEHIPLMTVQALRMMGHDVCDIRGTQIKGCRMTPYGRWRSGKSAC
jgi:hypothetical protein